MNPSIGNNPRWWWEAVALFGAVRRLIVSNAETADVTGLTGAEFEAQWFAFVRARYGL